MTMFEWAAIAALMLAILIFCARIMRRGLTTLDEDRQHYLERIKSGEKQLAEDRKKIPALEHLHIMRAALEDLIRLDGNPPGYSVQMHGRIIELVTPEGNWKIQLIMRERGLRSTSKVLHGKARWLLTGFDRQEEHPDHASLMRSLNARLHSKDDWHDNLPQLNRGTMHDASIKN